MNKGVIAKLPVYEIECASCHNSEHKTTILVEKEGMVLQCNKCGIRFRLRGTIVRMKMGVKFTR